MRAPTRSILAGALLATSMAFVAAPSSPASAATSPLRVSIIGDESLAGVEDATKPARDIITTTYATAFDSACQRETARAADPCTVGTATSALEVINATTGGDLGEILVMMTGYNDLPAGLAVDVDAVMAAALAQGVQRVVWLNLRLEGASVNQTTRWTANNATLAAKDTEYGDQLVVADWNTFSTGESARFKAAPAQYAIRTLEAGFLTTYLDAQVDAAVGLGGITPPPATPGAPTGDRCLPGNAVGVPSPNPSAQPFSSDGRGSNYTAIAPARLLDTRAGDGDSVNRMVGQGRIIRVDLSDRAQSVSLPNGIPANATAVTLNVTAVDTCAGGFVTVYPCGPGGPPLASTVNYRTGQIVANSVTVKLGSFNRACLYTLVQSDLIVDVAGFYSDATPAVGVGHTSADPQRLLDTRPGTVAVDPRKGQIAGQTDFSLPVAGVGAVPAGATGVVLNVTAVDTTANGFLAAYPAPCGPANRPTVSNVNFRQGQIVPNSVSVKVGTGGAVCFFSNVATDLIVDFNASFGTGSLLRSATPLRVIDTRGEPAALANPGKLVGQQPLPVPVLSAVPGNAAATADSVLLNVTVTQPDISGFLAVYPCGTTPPTVSNVNFQGGETRPNLVDVKVGTGGQVCVVSNVGTHAIVDLLGWYQA